MQTFSEAVAKEIPGALKVLAIPTPATVKEAAVILGMTFGPQLEEYLSVYGAISFGCTEFNGLTETKRNNSTLVRNTAYLREAFPGKLSGMVLLEDRGDGAYVLCDSSDRIWFFTPEISPSPMDSGFDLIQYTLRRFEKTEKG